MDAKSVRLRLASLASAGWALSRTARPLVVTALWLALRNVTMETKQAASNVQSFLDTNALVESVRNQTALSHVEMVLKHLLKPATMVTSQAAHRIASKTKDIYALLYLVRLLNVAQYAEMELWLAMRHAITE